MTALKRLRSVMADAGPDGVVTVAAVAAALAEVAPRAGGGCARCEACGRCAGCGYCRCEKPMVAVEAGR